MNQDSVSQMLETLRHRLGELSDVRSALAVLQWDMETYMPKRGAEARGQQLATLSTIAHRMQTSEKLGSLLWELMAERDKLDPTDRKLIEVSYYDYERATKLPAEFVHAMSEAESRAYTEWVDARAASDFKAFQPALERIVELLRQKTDYLGYEGSPYNALLEEFERGMTAEKLRGIFGELADKQSALVERIMASPNQPDLGWLEQPWDEDKQWAFSVEILKALGYPFDAGRQDRAVHPFTTSFDLYDVRVTTRTDPEDLFSCLTGTIHECGHAFYELGHDPADRRTPLRDGASLGIHESQSRMWENLIGRSLAFWERFTPRLKSYYPGQLDRLKPEDIWRAINRVRPSFIRVEADECTYNLHIVLRFEIEIAVLEGALAVSDIPEAWNAKMKDYLGLDVPNDAQGCLQDIHWAHGAMGYFPTYALGNLYMAELFEVIETDLPELWSQVRSGDFGPLLGWLRKHVHQHGRRKLATELLEDVTGHSPSSAPFLRYLETKYGALYQL